MSTPSPAIVEQAIAWRVRLDSGMAAAEDWQACAAWRAADAQHEQAWQRLESLGRRFAALPSGLARAALVAAPLDVSRRRALKGLGIGAVVLASGLLAQQWQPWQPYLAQQRTTLGERRRLNLPDGGQLHLNSATAVDIDYSRERRLIRLYQGEILVDTASDHLARPFLVSTDSGLLRALGTRFQVCELGDSCRLAVYAGAVEVRPRQGALQVVEAGSQVLFDRYGVGHASAVEVDRSSWVDGVLVARQMRLGDFIDELQRQRPGVLGCAPAVAELRISGVFPLHESDRVLAALGQTLPVRVVYRTRYWVSVQPA